MLRMTERRGARAAERAASLVRASDRIERRARVAWALGQAAEDRRLVLALLLYERLSPAEAASALGISVRRVRGSLRRTLADLAAAARGETADAIARPRRVRSTEPRLRKAS
jgi:DNA-directed RNA polymerase specialized sigma24 family protein